MSENLTVSEVARAIGRETGVEVQPRLISDLFYQRVLSDKMCPIVGGRRLIPRHYLPAIVAALRNRGKLRAAADNKEHRK